MYRLYIKRAIDLVLGLILIILIAPVFVVFVLLLLTQNSGSPFFVQERPGKGGRIFKVIKFKTMKDERDRQGNLLPDSMRLTSVGSFMRKTSLDEIPQLWNVIVGDMSLIGPRPLLVEYLPLYDPEEMRRHEVRPGITGWAQVNGRNAISWEQKFILDVWYVDHLNFALDCRIIFRTVIKVVRSEGISQSGHTTMSKFEGTK